jgi:crossover junction endodeoxyribonuclease RuvC
MRILGIDPGTSMLGWGVIEASGNRLSSAGCGVLNLSKTLDFKDKFRLITEKITSLIKEYDPEAVAVEEPFYAKNPKVLLRIGQAGGAVMAAAVISGRDVHSYSVLEIKQAVAGYGKADKKQVQEMVKILLKMDSLPSPADAADALAAAICHHNMVR